MNQQLVEYHVTDAAIAKMHSDFMSLTVKGLDDKRGLVEVHAARMIVKNTRIDVEKTRKALKADALAWGQKVDAEARRITKLLEPIEDHLTFEEEKITKEKARLEAEKKRLEEERAQSIVNEFAKYGVLMPYAEAMTITDADYAVKIESAKQSWQAEQERIAEEKRHEETRRQEEAAKAKAESERLLQERIELERMRAAEEAKRQAERAEAECKRLEQEAILAAEREKIAAERRAIEAERMRQEHAAAMERAKKEAAEKAEREAIARAEREAKEKEEAERKAKAEAERQERLKPDKEKMMALADKIESMPLPEVVSPSARIVMDGIKERVESLCEFIRKSVERI